MADGYIHDGDHEFSDLDEWLCEYVDGTIDPVVREALEEYMQVNPALACHVERLLETRHLLCRYGCRHQAPKGLQPRLRQRVTSEYVQSTQPLFSSLNLPLVTIATLCSVVAVMLIIVSAQPPASSGTAYTRSVETRTNGLSRAYRTPLPLFSPPQSSLNETELSLVGPTYARATHASISRSSIKPERSRITPDSMLNASAHIANQSYP